MERDTDAEMVERVSFRAAARDHNPAQLARHLFRGTFHRFKATDGSLLACGKKFDEEIFSRVVDETFIHPKCATCFGRD